MRKASLNFKMPAGSERPLSNSQFRCGPQPVITKQTFRVTASRDGDRDAPFEPGWEAEKNCIPAGTWRSGLPEGGKKGPRVSAMGFLAALVLLLVASPFVRGLKGGQLWEAVLYTFVMCTGLTASGSRRKLTFALGSLALCAIWLNQLCPQRCPALTFILPAMTFLAIVIASLLRFSLRAKRVDAEVLCAGISVYLILGLLWGLAYAFVAQMDPKAFLFSSHSAREATMSGFTTVYFSFTTLSTLGYGDITPASDIARMLAMVEAMTGTLFVGVMIARLVCLYSASIHRHTLAHSDGEDNNKQLSVL